MSFLEQCPANKFLGYNFQVQPKSELSITSGVPEMFHHYWSLASDDRGSLPRNSPNTLVCMFLLLKIEADLCKAPNRDEPEEDTLRHLCPLTQGADSVSGFVLGRRVSHRDVPLPKHSLFHYCPHFLSLLLSF